MRLPAPNPLPLHRRNLAALLEQSKKEVAAAPWGAPVEPERELVQVELEPMPAQAAVVRAEKPAPQERGDAVDARHHDVRRRGLLRDRLRVVDVARPAPLAPQAVGRPQLGIYPEERERDRVCGSWGSPTKGRSAISRARLIETATCFWCFRQVPVLPRPRIVPLTEMKRRSCAMFL
jgi:hypothetical protein